MSDNTLATSQPKTGMDRVRNYILSPEVKERFTDMMGPRAIYYLNQVLTIVASSKNLQECTPQSILIAAMRAASLQLSVDPGQGQAWIIPYKGEAQYQIGYKGVRELALRTREYIILNDDGYWYEGETFEADRITGLHKMGGKRTSNKIAGYFIYFKLKGGFEKTFAMTVEEIESHAAHYSQAYTNPRSKWNDPYERPKMMKKTVLVNGLKRYGKFNSTDADLMDQIEQEQMSERGFVEYDQLPEENQVSGQPEQPERTNAQMLNEFGIEPDQEAPAKHTVIDMIPTAPVVTIADLWPEDATVSYEIAATVANSKGVPYVNLDTKELMFRINALNTSLANTELTDDKRAALMLKRDTANIVLKIHAAAKL